MRTMSIWLLLAVSVFGQTIVAKNETVISGLHNVRQYGDFIVTDEVTEYKLIPAATVEIKTEASNVTVRFSDKDREPVPSIKISDTQYLLTTPGRIWIDAICIDLPKNIVQIEQSIVTIGPPTPPVPPTPPIPPVPDVPSDPFGNIGQRTAQWTKGLESNPQVGKIYLDNAKALRSSPNVTIDEQFKLLATALRAVPKFDTYTEFINNTNKDLQSRWPMSKGVLADYWTAIALGLGVK